MSLSRKIAQLVLTENFTLDNVIVLLTKYKMLSLLPSIKRAVIQMSLIRSKQDTIVIESPFLVSEDAIKKIKKIIGNEFGKHEVIINKKVLSGFRAKYKGVLYDGSAERIIKQIMSNSQ